jgi:hypothetical protein
MVYFFTHLFIHSFVLLLLILFTYLLIAKFLTSLQAVISNEFIMFKAEDVRTSGKQPLDDFTSRSVHTVQSAKLYGIL